MAIQDKSQMRFIQISNHSFSFMYYILAFKKISDLFQIFNDNL